MNVFDLMELEISPFVPDQTKYIIRSSHIGSSDVYERPLSRTGAIETGTIFNSTTKERELARILAANKNNASI